MNDCTFVLITELRRIYKAFKRQRWQSSGLDLFGRLVGGLKRKVCGLGNQVTEECSHGGRGSSPSTSAHTSTWQESLMRTRRKCNIWWATWKWLSILNGRGNVRQLSGLVWKEHVFRDSLADIFPLFHITYPKKANSSVCKTDGTSLYLHNGDIISLCI